MRMLALLLLTALAGTGSALAAETPGKALFVAKGCDSCHSVPAAGIVATTKVEKLKGPELVTDPLPPLAELGPYLRLEATREGKKHKKAFKGTDEELKTLIDWLATQQKPAG